MRSAANEYVSRVLDPDIRQLRSAAFDLSSEARDTRLYEIAEDAIQSMENLPELMVAGLHADLDMPLEDPWSVARDDLDRVKAKISSFVQDPTTRRPAQTMMALVESLQSKLTDDAITQGIILPVQRKQTT